MKAILYRYTPEPLITLDTVASVCYQSTPSNKGNIVKHCQRSGHDSVLEFVDFIFYVEDVSRALLAQLTRHRMASFAVKSQRYVSENGFEIMIPPTITENPSVKSEYQKHKDVTQGFYNYAVSKGIPKEDARYALPNSCYTNLYMKMNLRGLINFENLRLCTRAQKEIRDLAKELKRLVIEVLPEAENWLVPKCEINYEYPFCTEGKSCGKHPKLSEVYRI